MTQTKLADEYADIAARLAELEREKKETAGLPKAFPLHITTEPDDFYGYMGYRAPDECT